ncbi:MAG: alpha/beta hydrolase [Bacteroidales bacterium]|nr:alpha/beta hydrolase [Bacteroidales bacterium]
MHLSRILFFILFFLIAPDVSGKTHTGKDTMIYLFPGQGSDARLFKHFRIPVGFDTTHIAYPVPDRKESLATYALRFILEIDTTSPFILIGVSLGGMICIELADTLTPERVIIISSAKRSTELPGRYTFQQKIPLYRIIPKRLTKGGARLLQGIVEPDRKHDKETFKEMLKAKDPLYLKRTVDMIVNWNRTEYPDQVVHIHGDKDHTIPIKNVQYNYLVEDGSHMMMVTRANEINQIIGEVLLLE